MDKKSETSTEPVNADADAVEEKYGELAALYAESRSATAAALGREGSARKWRKVEDAVEAEARNKDD